MPQLTVTATKTIARRNTRTGKFSICFDMRRHVGSESYICAECESPAHFDTAQEAHLAGDRAVEYYNSNDGVFPNMCEKF